MRSLLFVLMSVGALTLATGCSKKSNVSSEGSSASESSGGSVKALTQKVVFKGEKRLEIKPKDDGAKLVGEGEQEIARYKVKGDAYKVKNPSDEAIGYIKPRGNKIKIEGPNKEVWFVLVRQDDGDLKLEDGHDTLIYKVKVKGENRKIEDASGTKIGEVKVKDDHVELRDASDNDRLKTHDKADPDAVACLGFDRVDLPLRVGLFVAIQASK